MTLTQGEKNKEIYNYYYKKGQQDGREVYTKKMYNRNFTDEDRKKVESHFAFRKTPMETKHMLLFVIMGILFLFFGHFYYNNESDISTILFIILFFFIAVGVFHNVNGKFYLVLLALIVITIIISTGLVEKIFHYSLNKISFSKNNKANNKANNK